MGQSASTTSSTKNAAANNGATRTNSVAASNGAALSQQQQQEQQWFQAQQALMWAQQQQQQQQQAPQKACGSCSSSSAGAVAFGVGSGDCLRRAQQGFQYEKDLSRYNRLNDATSCKNACTHQFQTACRRGCSQTDLMWEAGVTTPNDRFARESAVLAKQLAAQQRTLQSKNQRYGGFDTVPTNGRNSATAAPLAPNSTLLGPLSPLNGGTAVMSPPNLPPAIPVGNNGRLLNNTAPSAINASARDEEAADAVPGLIRPPINAVNFVGSPVLNGVPLNNAAALNGVNLAALNAAAAASANSLAGGIPSHNLAAGSVFGGSIF